MFDSQQQFLVVRTQKLKKAKTNRNELFFYTEVGELLVIECYDGKQRQKSNGGCDFISSCIILSFVERSIPKYSKYLVELVDFLNVAII